MPYMFFTVQAAQSDEAEELNAFLRGHKVLSVHKEFAHDGGGSRWCLCVEYLDGQPPRVGGDWREERIDYRKVLPDEDFARFRILREARKKVAEEAGDLPFDILYNRDLAELAKTGSPPTREGLLAIKGFGDRKMEKYGTRFLELAAAGFAGGGAVDGQADTAAEPNP